MSDESVWHVTRDGVPVAPGPAAPGPAAPGADGFVHASFTRQLDGTLALHFAGAPRVELLLLDPARLGEALRLEASRGGEAFPHIYRPLRPEDVLARVGLSRGADGRFATSLLPG